MERASKYIMERREHIRIPMQMHTEIEIYLGARGRDDDTCPGKSIHALVNTIDVSLGGFCVKIIHSSLVTDKSFRPAIAYTLTGKTITAYFKENDMTVNGKVVRIDPKTMLMAVVITWVSDITLWRQFCGGIIYDQSVQ